MLTKTCRIALLVLALAVSARELSAGELCTAFAIVRAADGVAVEPVSIGDGELREFKPGGTFVTLVVPVGVGRSGDLVQSANMGTLKASCTAGTLRVVVQNGEQSREVLARPMTELRGLDVRVGVTTGSGARGRWRIDQWRTAAREDGPVLDLFAGQIPLGPGDASITTDVEVATAPTRGPAATGGAPCDSRAAIRLPTSRSEASRTALFDPPRRVLLLARSPRTVARARVSRRIRGPSAANACPGRARVTPRCASIAGLSPFLAVTLFPFLFSRPWKVAAGQAVRTPRTRLRSCAAPGRSGQRER